MQKVLLLVAALALFAVVVVAQHPRHCESPWEMEAHGFQFDPKLNFFRRGRIFYDARNERSALIEEVMNDTSRDYFHTIQLFREHKAYDLNLKTRVCTTRDIHHHFHPLHIPREAHFIGEAIVGTNAFDGAGVLTTHWHHHNDTEKTEWFGVYTDRDIGCLPVSDHFSDPQIGTVRTDFFDIVLGISDPNVFVPPHECDQAVAPAKPTRPNRPARHNRH